MQEGRKEEEFLILTSATQAQKNNLHLKIFFECQFPTGNEL